MKSPSSWINTLILGLLVLALLIVSLPQINAQAARVIQAPSQTTKECDQSRTVHVSGTAVVNVTPDRVLVQLGVQSNGRTPQQVEAANSATIYRVIQALKKLGIEEKDIVTDWYMIEPVYENYDSLQIRGYRINNMVAVTLREITLANDVIIAALSAGANRVINVEFYLSDLRKYRDQARELAMIAAGEKAQDLAEAAGAEAGCVVSINENTWSYFNSGWYGRDDNLWTQNVVQNAAPVRGMEDQLAFGPVNVGQISVRAEVSAVYSLQ